MVRTKFFLHDNFNYRLASLNISREKIFADFVILGVISENFIIEIFRLPYSLIHFGSVCKSTKKIFFETLLNLE